MANSSTISASPKNPDSEKSKRYDRQLRLWGEHGQQALETSHVCLINANVAGTETLKSLVLPGIRAFTIIDDKKVTEDDYDSNFFLCTETALGESRAKVAAQMLLEMNSDVKKGDYVEENFESLLEQNSLFFTNFTLVIACGIESERSLNKLSQHLWTLNVPLLVVKSIGYLGYLRLQIKEHAVFEPHPDNFLEDLRLDAVFPELAAYFETYPESLESLSRKELSQVPALVIIYKALLRWRETFERADNEVPTNYKEKTTLKALLVNEMELFKEKQQEQQKLSEEKENKDDGCDEEDVVTSAHSAPLLDLENYEEAIKMLNSVFTNSHGIPEEVQRLLDEVAENDQLKLSSPFWMMMSGLRTFVDTYGALPLAGTLPDMNCASEQYARLQKVYRAKAKADVEKLYSLTQQAVPKCSVSEADLTVLARNARFLRLIRTGPIADELSPSSPSPALRQLATSRLQNGGAEEEGAEYDELRFYLLMRLVDRFHAKQNRFPGQRDDEVESDIAELKREFRDLSNDLGCNMFIKDELIHEICRYGGCELHSISSFLGGCAAQEAIKIITGQYVPIDNTFVYNALTSTSITYTL